MIQASELMIGNLISFEGLICIINKIDEQGVVVKFQKNNELEWIDLFQFYPIPLTEEWLLKFGFEITKQTKEDNNIWTFKGSECKFELEQIIKFHLYDNMHFGTEIKHVHQLQNLYFALTGEELKFKTTKKKINKIKNFKKTIQSVIKIGDIINAEVFGVIGIYKVEMIEVGLNNENVRPTDLIIKLKLSFNDRKSTLTCTSNDITYIRHTVNVVDDDANVFGK